MGKLKSSALCQPRFLVPRRPERPTLGPAVAEVAKLLGQPLMPWQEQVANVGLELLPDGRPAYREVGFTVPRQSGKTTLILAWQIQRALGWANILGFPQRIAYSAQTGKDAREKLLEDQVPIIEPRRQLLGISKIYRAIGSESVTWRNGSRLVLLASGEDSGHGKTLDMGVKDELFADTDFRRDQALNPAMATKPFAQIITASTAGTAESVALNRAVTNGRAACEADSGKGIAYFEWSAGAEDDPADQETWWRCMPALGRTISLEVVEHAYQTLKLDEFRRAYLNIPTASDERVIPAAIWAAVCDPDVEATAGVFAFDVNPERSTAAIVAVGAGPVVEVVDYRPGTGWLLDRICELHQRHGSRFAVDKGGPAGGFVAELTRRGIPLMETDAKELTQASGMFYDRVMTEGLVVRQNSDLDSAVAGAAKRPVGDSWAWGRKGSRFDVSLLVAASLGLWASENALEPATPKISLA